MKKKYGKVLHVLSTKCAMIGGKMLFVLTITEEHHGFMWSFCPKVQAAACPFRRWLWAVVWRVGADGKKKRIDYIWLFLYDMESSFATNFPFRKLFVAAKIVLLNPHPNAGIERACSLVSKRKQEGSERNRMKIDGVLSSILDVMMPKGLPQKYSNSHS